MTVETLTQTMTTSELCHWIAADNLDALQSNIAHKMGISVGELCSATDDETMINLIEMERSNGKT